LNFKDPDVFVFILTTRVGGLGVNLTAANRVILYDPDWNPSTDIQARERAWRIGQHRAVTIYRLILSGTIEEKMYHRQVFKQFLTNRVLKDPRQKRFFKSNEMLELFQFNEGTKGTESEAIFAGTGSAIKVKKSKKSRKEPREKSSGKLKDVPNLVKQRPSKATLEETASSSVDPKTNAQQDEYVLQKLFSNSGVHAALRHDKIVDTDEADYMIVEKEAESVAKKAIETLKQSRELCFGAVSGRVNWTGNQGEVKNSPTAPKLRFGKKKQKSSTVTSTVPSSTVTSEPSKAVAEEEEEDQTPSQYFSGHSLLQEALNKKISLSNNNAVMSSADLLSIIRTRKSSMPIPDSRDDSQASTQSTGPELKEEQLELLRDIREFISFQATIDGQATTDELIEKFGPRLPNGHSPLFKQMLGQLCTFRRVEGRGMWRLKPEFR
jgi:DNA excision repair protein ERCC-6